MELILKNGLVLSDDWRFSRRDIYISNGMIADSSSDGEIVDAEGLYVLPGLIDSHIHGCMGLSCYAHGGQAVEVMSRFLAEKGVTGFAPTLTPGDVDETLSIIKSISRETQGLSGARVLGIHLEGPFVSHEKRGALLDNYIRECDCSLLARYFDCEGGELIRIITVAPEKPGAQELIRFAVSRGAAVSLGHSFSDCETARRAVSWGASRTTHTYNAMRAFDHREPGILGAAMVDDGLCCELIADFIHVSPAACEILCRLKGDDNITLISDSEWAAGMPDGEYKEPAGRTEYIRDGKLVLANGTIAGSTKWVLFGVQNLVREGILSLESAVKCASINPAKALRADGETGSITAGKRADIILLDRDLELVRTICGGKTVYKR